MDVRNKVEIIRTKNKIRMDDWITINGAHVEIGEGGELQGGVGEKIAGGDAVKNSGFKQLKNGTWKKGNLRVIEKNGKFSAYKKADYGESKLDTYNSLEDAINDITSDDFEVNRAIRAISKDELDVGDVGNIQTAYASLDDKTKDKAFDKLCEHVKGQYSDEYMDEKVVGEGDKRYYRITGFHGNSTDVTVVAHKTGEIFNERNLKDGEFAKRIKAIKK